MVLRNMLERPTMDHFKANFNHYAMSATRLQPSTHLVGPWPSTWLGYGHQVPALDMTYKKPLGLYSCIICEYYIFFH